MKKSAENVSARDGDQKARPVRYLDLKSLLPRQRTAVRRRVFEAYGKGEGIAETAEKLGLRPATVRQMFRRFGIEGESAVQEKPRGAPGHFRGVLAQEEMDALEAALAGGGPREAGVKGFGLWSTQAVVAWARQRCGKEMSARSALGALQRLGYSRESPLPDTRKPVREWKEANYEECRRLAARKGAIVLWCGEMIASPCTAGGRKGAGGEVLPEAEVPRVGVFAAQGNNGATFFMPLAERMSPEWFKGFVERLAEDVGKPLVLVLEDRSVFRKGPMEDWSRKQRQAGRLWMRFCPKLPRPRLPGVEPVRRRGAEEVDWDAFFG